MKSIFLTVLTVPLLCHLTQGCCTPEQWRGYMTFLVGTNKNGKETYEAGIVNLFYDAKKKKIAAFSKVYNVDGKIFIGVMIQNFEEGVQYVVLNGACNTTKLAGKEFKPACIPPEGKKVSDTHVGTSTDSLGVSTYEIPLKEGKGMSNITVSNKLCIPIDDNVQGGTEKESFMASIGYTGIEPGIEDPRIFDKPRECRDKIEEGEIDLFEKFGMLNHKMSSLFR
ncbi:uncharacterized protein LOC134269896 [Saccostrea cucullata]|uniref:uncharacterized protein LOC134269896 n=1 Tax=Saccostrea cuccullata TaxID=36930 RepID=UPI002ED3FE0A